MTKNYTALQIDALGEVANIGSGHAAGDLSEMLGTSFTLSVPHVEVADIQQILDYLGGAEKEAACVTADIFGGSEATLIAIFDLEDAEQLCALQGIEAQSEIGMSLLGEIGNVLACAYANVHSEMSELEHDVSTPEVVIDMLGAFVTSLIAGSLGSSDALLIDTQLSADGFNGNVNILYLPKSESVSQLLNRLNAG